MTVIPIRRERTLAHVLLEIQQVGPKVWNFKPNWPDDHCSCPALPDRDDPYYQCSFCEQEQEIGPFLDRLDALQAEARAMVEAATGVTWEQLQGANL